MKNITSTKDLKREANARMGRKKKPTTLVAILFAVKLFLIFFVDSVIATTVFTYIVPVITSYLCGAGNITPDTDLRFAVNAWLLPALGFTVAIAIMTVWGIIAFDKYINKCFKSLINKIKSKYDTNAEEN